MFHVQMIYKPLNAAKYQQVKSCYTPYKQQYPVLTEMKNAENSEEAECCSFLLLVCRSPVHPLIKNIYTNKQQNIVQQ